MSGQADRMEALVKYRIEQNRHDRNDVPRLAGARFKPLQLAGAAAAVGRDYQRQRWSVGELLAWQDRQFVQNAYLVLLKRDADVDGLNARLQLLHSGRKSRLELRFGLRSGRRPGGAFRGEVRHQTRIGACRNGEAARLLLRRSTDRRLRRSAGAHPWGAGGRLRAALR